MTTSFKTALKAAESDSKPRFVYLGGSQYSLRKMLLEAFVADSDAEIHYADNDVWLELFSLPDRPSKTRLVVVENAETLSPAKLSIWFKKCKPTRMIALSSKNYFPDKILEVVKTKGIFVYCGIPYKTQRQYFSHLLAERYGLTVLQALSLLHKCDWNIDLFTNTMKEINLLNLPYSEKLATMFGVTVSEHKFKQALLAGNKVEAIMVAKRMTNIELSDIIDSLDNEVNILYRLNKAAIGMKKPYELANELGVPKSKVTEILPLSKKYTLPKLISSSFALAKASTNYGAHPNHTLEMLVHQW